MISTNKPKRTLTVIFIVALVIIVCLIYKRTSDESDMINNKSEFIVVKDDLYEVTPEGDYYIHTFRGKPQEALAPDMSDDIEYTFRNVPDYVTPEDKEIALNADNFSSSFNIAYIKEGKVYVKGFNHYGHLGLGNTNDVKEYTMIDNLPAAAKVCVERPDSRATVILTQDNRLFICGQHNEYMEEEPYWFYEISSDEKFIDIVSSELNTIVLDGGGNVYFVSGYLYSKELNKGIKQIYANQSTSFALSEDGKTIYAWGQKFEGKSVKDSSNIITFKYNADRMLASNNYIFIFEGNKIIRLLYK